jgi:hypothetical protein
VLRRQLDDRFPGRSRASDGIMGDPAHARRKSDHNSGNAIDVTHDVAHGVDAGRIAEEFRRQMSGAPAGRISYIIYNRRICGPKQAWAWRPYTGPNPHTGHVHISIVDSRRGETRPWHF